MPSIRISKRTVDALKATGTEQFIWDDLLIGFGVRVRESGAKSYVVKYRTGNGRNAPTRRLTLGPAGTLTPDEARKLARAALAEVAQGGDPAGDRSEARSAPTLAELAGRWMKEEITPTRKPGTAALYQTYLGKHVLPAIGNIKARDVTRARVAKLHRAIGATAPVTANRVVQALSGLYAWAVSAGELPDGYPNPSKGITKFKETAKERFLATEEVIRLGDALRLAETEGLPWTPDPSKKSKHVPKGRRRVVIGREVTSAIRLLLLTGCRLREILHLRWEDVDFERGLATLPDSKVGRRPIVLPAPALSLLDGLERFGPYVIPGDDPMKPRSDLKKPWARISQYAGLDGVRLHDLRHSFAATGAGAGFGLPVIGRLLGHTQPTTTARYAHLANDPVRAAADRIAGTLAAALNPQEPNDATVVDLAQARR